MSDVSRSDVRSRVPGGSHRTGVQTRSDVVIRRFYLGHSNPWPRLPTQMTPKERNQSIIRPTPEQIAAAHGRTLPDVITPGLQVLFVGINPSLYSAAVGHHFARPGNRFWRVLHAAGFTSRLVSPF